MHACEDLGCGCVSAWCTCALHETHAGMLLGVCVHLSVCTCVLWGACVLLGACTYLLRAACNGMLSATEYILEQQICELLGKRVVAYLPAF